MKHSKIRNSGFTLLEVLITIGILVILLALSVVGVVRYRDHLKLTELDNAARDIYMAAENRAVLLQSSGATVALLGTGGADEIVLLSTMATGDNDTLEKLLPVGSIDPALRNGQFVVIYDKQTHHAKEVFYAEGEFDAADLSPFRKTRSDRVSDYRSKTTARLVGRYGGDLADPIGTYPLPTPGVEVFIKNSNELTLTVRYTMPTEGLPAGGVTRTPNVTLEYKDPADPTNPAKTKIVDLWNSPRKKSVGGDITLSGFDVVEYTWVLDSLEKDAVGNSRQFKDLLGGTAPGLGDNFTVKAGLKLTADGCIDSAYYATGEDNSLFAKGSTYNAADDTGTALIANLRHLQNLCSSSTSFTSGAGGGIKNARQLVDINCETYLTDTAYKFVPIVNTNLASYNGMDGAKNTHIYNLSTIDTDNAGLFGEVANELTIENCRVCWSTPENLVKTTGADKGYIYAVSGASAGGLVGRVSGTGIVTIKNSFAATTVKSTGNAGGLVGSTETGSNVMIENSYADCYLNAGTGMGSKEAGGLVGSGSGSVTLTNAYAAGFITGGTNTAGLAGGSVTVASRAYSVVRVIGADGKLAKPDMPLYGDNADTKGTCFYLSNQGSITGDVITTLTTAFERGTNKPETHVYDLRNRLDSEVESLAGRTYPYPGLKDLPHYSDWADPNSLIALPEADMRIIIKNDEELTLTVEYTMPELPEGLTYSEVTRTPSVVVKYPYKDAHDTDVLATAELIGGRTPAIRGDINDINDPGALAGNTVSYTWVLDSLENGVFQSLGFENLVYKDLEGNDATAAFGGDFTVSASLKLTTEKAGYETSNNAEPLESATENSLFSKDSISSSDTAYVANLRHLQNLDSVHSGAGGKANAEQTTRTSRETETVRKFDADGNKEETSATTVTTVTPAATTTMVTTIDAGGENTATNTTAGDQNSTMIDAGTVKDNDGPVKKYEFKPITNWDLFTYDGKGMTIKNLNVTAESADGKNSAGLFAIAQVNFQFKDICLEAPEVTGGSMIAGTLLGSSWNSAQFINCRIDSATVTSSTNFAGGLMGNPASNVTFTNCHAANTTVKSASSVAGGLAGATWSGTVTFNQCGAESLTVTSDTNYAGGLMGWNGNGTVSFTDCTVGQDGETNIAITGAHAGGMLGNSGSTEYPAMVTFTNCTVGKQNGGKKVIITGKYYTGGLAGNTYKGTYNNCTTYNVTMSNSDWGYSGGLVGYSEGNCTFTGCKAISPKAAATAAAGGMAGGMRGKSTFTGCQVYLDSNDKPIGNGGLQYQVTAETAGGLVGQIGDNTNIETSFAATLVRGTAYAGGLVGSLGGTGYSATILNSYADCYIQAGADSIGYPRAGGLIGIKEQDGSQLVLANVYAAGFIEMIGGERMAGGLYSGWAGGATATNTYVAMHYKNAAVIYPLAAGMAYNAGTTNCYCLNYSGLVYADNTNVKKTYQEMRSIPMGSAFGTPTATNPYGLSTNAGTGNYPFPGLKGLPHYGDWVKQ